MDTAGNEHRMDVAALTISIIAILIVGVIALRELGRKSWRRTIFDRQRPWRCGEVYAAGFADPFGSARDFHDQTHRAAPVVRVLRLGPLDENG